MNDVVSKAIAGNTIAHTSGIMQSMNIGIRQTPSFLRPPLPSLAADGGVAPTAQNNPPRPDHADRQNEHGHRVGRGQTEQGRLPIP